MDESEGGALPGGGPGEQPFKSGFVSIVGRPNVGKSTLLNHLAKQKIAIISDKPQTTRNQIRGVVNLEAAQVIFIDTPGLQKPKNLLNERMNRSVRETYSQVDAIVFILDASRRIGSGDLYIAGELGALDTPVIALLNKVDLLDERQVEAQRLVAERLHKFRGLVPISARTGQNVEAVLSQLVEILPEGPKYYPDDMVTDQPAAFLIAEFIREKAIDLTREEVPFNLAVQVEEITPREGKDMIYVEAVIYVAQDSQKGIIIGKGGRMLKEIGSKARVEIEPLLGSGIYLDLRVKVEKEWAKRPQSLQKLGY
jgi:GTP-binding protein Era